MKLVHFNRRFLTGGKCKHRGSSRRDFLSLAGMMTIATALSPTTPRSANAKENNLFFLDHVVLAVRDLNTASKYLMDRFGLDTVEGGDHPEWGTGNLIVPLGDHFIEVAGITDEKRALENPVGQIFLDRTADGDKFLTPVLGARDLAVASERLGLEWVAGERKTETGTLGFRSAGIGMAMEMGEGWPYFFDYDDRVARLGIGMPNHSKQVTGILNVTVAQNADRLRGFLGEEIRELTVTQGDPAVHSVTIATEDGEITLPGKM